MLATYGIARLLAVTTAIFASVQGQANNFGCPQNDGQVVTDSNDIQYIVGCNTDTSGNTFSQAQSSTFGGCFPLCDSTPGCTGFSYLDENCYFKNSDPEQFTSQGSDPALQAAILLSAYPPTPNFTCPADNSDVVTDLYGNSYVLGCGYDTVYPSYTTGATPQGFDDCFRLCSNSSLYPTTGGAGHCTAFTYSGGANGIGGGSCYLKNGLLDSFIGGGNPNFVAAIMVQEYSGTTPTGSLAASSLGGGPTGIVGQGGTGGGPNILATITTQIFATSTSIYLTTLTSPSSQAEAIEILEVEDTIEYIVVVD